ncbi:MAG: type II toxin-antitoxin system RelE/ParE family toxin [Candidatus Falkowbacteria bacterium]
MFIDFKKDFIKSLDKAPVKIQAAFYKQIKIFELDPFCPVLRNHKLTGEFNSCRSIDITGDWRAIYEEKNEDIVVFLLLGTHSKLYG